VASADYGIGKLDTQIARYGRGENINMSLNASEVKQFEDMYGAVISGRRMNNLDDVGAYLQDYKDLYSQIKKQRGYIAKSERFKKRSSQEIVEEVTDELVAAGMEPRDLAELAKASRADVLDFIEGIPGLEPHALVDMPPGASYYGAVLNPDALNMLNMVGDNLVR
jgi:hypothetical protein